MVSRRGRNRQDDIREDGALCQRLLLWEIHRLRSSTIVRESSWHLKMELNSLLVKSTVTIGKETVSVPRGTVVRDFLWLARARQVKVDCLRKRPRKGWLCRSKRGGTVAAARRYLLVRAVTVGTPPARSVQRRPAVSVDRCAQS